MRWAAEHRARLESSWSHWFAGSAPDPVACARAVETPAHRDVLVRLAWRRTSEGTPQLETGWRELSPPPRVARWARTPRRESVAHRRHKQLDRRWVPKVATGEEVLVWSAEHGALEGTRTNLWRWSEGRLQTPPRSVGVVPGVVRARLLAAGTRLGFTVEEAECPRSSWATADALFLSGVGVEFVPLRAIDGRTLPKTPIVGLLRRVRRWLREP